jgi:transposase
MSFTSFIGIDVSKKTIDAVIYVSAALPVQHRQFDNRPSGFKELLAWVSRHAGKQGLLFCLEHTGIYALPLCCFFTQEKLSYSQQSALQVKKSMGIQRGKSDKADAHMLARYAYLYREEIQLSQLPSQALLKIQHLIAYRQRLVKNKVALEVSAKELRFPAGTAFTDKQFSARIVKDSQKHIKQLQESIASIDKQLEQVIKDDDEVHRVYKLATSVTGIGLQTAALMILHTNCFSSFDTWRQFACYSGTAPFEHSSGTSIRGKTRLSKVGNMKMKALLSNGAAAAIQSPNEFSVYYHRKVAEGKPNLIALNGVKNKMISRVFAVVQRGKPYVKDPVKYLKAAS